MVELAILGTARMAMRDAGVGELPPLPAPRTEIIPDAPLNPKLKQRFSEAVGRAKNWKQEIVAQFETPPSIQSG